MELVLEVISYKGLSSVGGLSARFTEQGGSIGRSTENRLALPDEEKFISRHHANIRFEGGGFVIQDVSTGGTWLSSKQRMLSQASSPLEDGDQLKIGEYEIRVRIEAAVQGEFAGFFGEPPDALATPFGSPPSAAPLDMFADIPTPLALGPLPAPADSQAFPSLIGQPDALSYQESFTPPGIQHNPAPQSQEVDFSIDNFFQDAFESPPSPKPAPASGQEDFPDLDALLGGGLDLHGQPQIQAGQSVEEGLLPDSVDFFGADGSVGASLDLKTAATPFQGGNATPHAAPPMPEPVEGDLFGRPIGDLPLTPPEKPSPAINIPKPGRPSIQAPEVPAEPVPAVPAPPRQPQAQPVAVHSVAGEPADLFRFFLEGAGLSALSGLTPEEQQKAMKAVGLAYREMVDGLMQVLLARKMEKSMIALRRTDVTMVQPRENNPLKVFPTVEETMKEMVCQDNPAYIGPAEAVREGFADIMRHQMAMRAGMQAALDGFLHRVDPKIFEELYKEGIVFQKKAKCWDAYCQAYPKLVNEAMDDLFGDAFAEAYRQQLRILRDPQR